MNTQDVIYSMLTENTGSHFLDSGGSGGRMWQRNAEKTIEDFRNEPQESYEFDHESGWLTRNVSLFHYLSELLQDNLCRAFNKIQDEGNEEDGDIFYRVELEAEKLLEYTNRTEEQIHSSTEFNTYNGDSDLSQVIQAKNLFLNDDHYLLLQIHGGADVRGGYTKTKLFLLQDEYTIHEYLMEYEDTDDVDFEEALDPTTGKTYTDEQVRARQYFLKVMEGNDGNQRYSSYTPDI